jgi:methyl-accepting chemotaxis protein
MKLCVIPLLSAALLFIAHSVIIAYQVRDRAGVEVEMGWIARQWTIVFVVMFACFFIPITINIKKLIIPIRQLSKAAQSMADGDVNVSVTKDREDEIGVLQESFQNLTAASRQQADMLRRIADGDISGQYTPRSDADIVGQSLAQMLHHNNELISQVKTAAMQLLEETKQIADGAQTLAAGSTEQASAVERLSGSLSEIAERTDSSAALAGKTAKLSEAIRKNAEKGSKQMDQLVLAVREINEAGKNIGKVIKVIDDIASQTNILSLNAAVEAARAGQHGKGFAVVAEEVRSLAAKSAEAARNTGELIGQSVQKAELGVRIAGETAGSLSEIVTGINESNLMITDIAESSAQQSRAIEQVTKGIEEVSKVVQQNSATAEESAAASEEMNGQAIMLEGLVECFKLESDTALPAASRRKQGYFLN